MGSRLENNSNAVRKRIENHTFLDETGEEYEPSAFGGFSEYYRRKKIKLQNLDSELRATSSGKPQIFKGVVAHVTGYTQPPLHILHHQLVEHGAGFLQYLESKTAATHIIASSLPPKKKVDFNKYRMVKPAWVTDSIKAGKLLPWSDYRVIEETPRQKTLKLDGTGFTAQTRTQQTPLAGYREQTENSFYTSQLKDFADRIDVKNESQDTPSRSKPTTLNEQASSDQSPGVNAPHLELGHDPGSDRTDYLLQDIPVDDPDGVNIQQDIPALNIPDLEGSEVATESSRPETGPLDEQQKVMTSEEHNALLLQDPRMRKSSTANPDFIQQYYSESRLHHLSTWKAELKAKMQRLASEKSQHRKPAGRKPGSRRYILHVDFDSFFCAVSLEKAPDYIDKPAVVAHGTGTGSEIASCNYPARRFGVKNGMWMKRAKELCPELKILPYDFPAYEETSKLFYECIMESGGIVQSVSIDEALVDASSVILAAVGSDGSGLDEGSIWREQERANQIARSLRDDIKLKTGCAVSVGIGGNILLAKVALRKAKPAGQHQIKPEEVLDFLGELKVDDLPGVAYSTAGKLEEIGVKFVKDIRQTSKERLVATLGPKTGEKIWDYARGIDKSEVGEQTIRKSVSAEVNWGIRFINQEEAEQFVFNLCKELEKRLLNEQVKGKQLTMKIMRRSLDSPLDPPKHLGHGKCDTFNKSVVFGVATHDYQVLGKEAVSVLRSFKFSPGDLRGLGVQLTKLESIKVALSGPDGSQKKLDFGVFKSPAMVKKPTKDPIQDAAHAEEHADSPSARNDALDQIIDGPLTPRKPKPDTSHPALTIARAGDKDKKAGMPLNITGTQFVVPSNPDPAVLEELPQDIRTKLMTQGRAKHSLGIVSESTEGRSTTHDRSRTQSPALVDEVPAEFDPDVFNALPDDMKAEILNSYKPLPAHSPRKDRVIPPSKKTTPTKRRGGLFARTRERQADVHAKIVQTSLLSHQQADDTELSEVEELDQVFLAQLPEDVRKEIMAEHRRRKAQRSGLDLTNLNRAKANQDDAADDSGVLPGGQTTLNFAPRPPKIGFTKNGLTTVSEIRDLLDIWYRETSERDGPHKRDVDDFEKYLVRVVVEERDMDKPQKLLRWLDFLIDEDESDSAGQKSWIGVLKGIKEGVQKVVEDRGLGRLDLG